MRPINYIRTIGEETLYTTAKTKEATEHLEKEGWQAIGSSIYTGIDVTIKDLEPDCHPDLPLAIEESDVELPVRIQVYPCDVRIQFPGYGEYNAPEESSYVLHLEYRSGVPHVVIKGDINLDDPTHDISLAPAAEKHRVEEYAA